MINWHRNLKFFIITNANHPEVVFGEITLGDDRMEPSRAELVSHKGNAFGPVARENAAGKRP